MTSQKKLNTYDVESPCERLPGVGSSLANPGLSKEQHLRRCTMRAFILPNTSIGIPAQYIRRYMVATFAMENTSIGILAQNLRRCPITTSPLADISNGIPPSNLRRCVLTTSVISYISMTVSTIALISLGFISPVICANLQPFSPVINTPISVMSFSSPFASTRMSLSASLSLANS